MNTRQLRQKLASSSESMEKIAYQSGVSYSWLTKFYVGTMENPRQSTLDKLIAYFKAAK